MRVVLVRQPLHVVLSFSPVGPVRPAGPAVLYSPVYMFIASVMSAILIILYKPCQILQYVQVIVG